MRSTPSATSSGPFAASGRPLRAVLAQTKPAKGDVRRNVETAKAMLDPAADLVVFPESALSGYVLEGGVEEVALSRAELVEAMGEPPPGCGCDVVLGFYERDRHGLCNSAAYLTPRGRRYEVVHIHRKLFLPTYGLFDEGRFVEPGRDLRAFDTRFGRMGLLVCEDLWHGLPATVLALDGAEAVLCVAASPARGFWPLPDAPAAVAPPLGRTEPRPAPAPLPSNLRAWDRLGSCAAREHGVFVLASQLAGSEGGKLFSGGSTAWGPDGELLARGPLFAAGCVGAELPMGEIARVRARRPFLADLRAVLPVLRRSLDRAAGRGSAVGTDSSAPAADGRNAEPSRAFPGAAAGPAALVASLEIDASLVEAALVVFLQDEVVRRRGFERVVVGVSGGVDSAVVLFLACRALGAENVFGFLLPHSTSSPESLEHGAMVVEAAGARGRTLPVAGAVDGYVGAHEPDAAPVRQGNFAARVRAAVLFDQSAKRDALPLGTGNKSERLLGYFTWHADDSPPVNPLGDLFKTQVLALAHHLGVPDEIVSKPASPDLVPGVHDEDELGISYRRADPILSGLVQGHAPEALVAAGFPPSDVELVHGRLSRTHWKRRPPTVAMLSDTAIGESYLRPVDYSAAS